MDGQSMTPTLNQLLIGVNSANQAAAKPTFTTEIMSMMQGFGDSPHPMAESAQLIEEIVHQQMMSLLLQALDVGTQRGSRSVSIEEILFLMRKDRLKLVRLLRYLSFKDAAPAGGPSVEAGGPVNVDVDLLFSGVSGAIAGQEVVTTTVVPRSKRLKLCHDFLSSIDETGELMSAFDEDFFDEIKHQRNLRVERMTRTMSETQYLQYCQARRVSFANKASPSKFRDWLLNGGEDSHLFVDLKPDALAIEVLQYLAFETVAQIVDLCLLVKQGQRRDVADPVRGLLSEKMKNPECPIFQIREQNCSQASSTIGQSAASAAETPSSSTFEESLLSSSSADSANKEKLLLRNFAQVSPKSNQRKKGEGKINLETPLEQSIQPSDVREVVRRYFGPSGPFTLLQKNTNGSSSHQRLQQHHRTQSSVDSQHQQHAAFQQLITIIGDMQRNGCNAASNTRQRMETTLEMILQRLEGIERKVEASVTTQHNNERKLAKLENVLDEREFSRDQSLRSVVELSAKVTMEANRLTNKLDRSVDQLTQRLTGLEGTVTKSEQRTLRTLQERQAQQQPSGSAQLDTVERMLEEIRQWTRSYEGRANSRLGSMERLMERTEASISGARADMIATANATLTNIKRTLAPGSQRSPLAKDSHTVATDPGAVGSGGALQSGVLRRATARDVTEDDQLINGVAQSADQLQMSQFLTQGDGEAALKNTTLVRLVALAGAMSAQEAKFKKLDEDIETYTRKVLNNIQELWKSSRDNELVVNATLDMGNQTRRAIKEGLEGVVERLSPLGHFKLLLGDLRSDFGSKIGELSSHIQTDYVSILAAQNAFIESCSRIQNGEAMLYHDLELVINELLNSSIEQQQMIKTTVSAHNGHVGERLDKIYALMVKVVKWLKQERAFVDEEGQQQPQQKQLTQKQVTGHQQQCQLSSQASQDLATQIAALLRPMVNST